MFLPSHSTQICATSMHGDLRTDDVQVLVPWSSSRIVGRGGYASHFNAGLGEAKSELEVHTELQSSEFGEMGVASLGSSIPSSPPRSVCFGVSVDHVLVSVMFGIAPECGCLFQTSLLTVQ